MKEEELEKLKHKNKMKQIEAKKKAEIEIEDLKFGHALQQQRIRSADIRRTIDRQTDRKFMENIAR